MLNVNWKELIEINYEEILKNGNEAYSKMQLGNDFDGYSREIILDENGNVSHISKFGTSKYTFDDGRDFITIISLNNENDFLVEEDYSKKYIATLKKEKIEVQIQKKLSGK
jgi:hypothetical protein